MKILLGSQSPRRRELLAGLDVDFRVVAIDADEHYPEGLTGGDIPYYISRSKAEASLSVYHPEKAVVPSLARSGRRMTWALVVKGSLVPLIVKETGRLPLLSAQWE